MKAKFTPTAHSTVAQKERFAAHFQRFVLKGFKRTMFHKWFYTRLSMCFGHIAHTNEEGFYQEWFIDTSARCRFVRHCVEFQVHGDPAHTYSDVEEYLQEWLKKERILQTLAGAVQIEQEEAEIRLRDSLIAKHGVPNYDIPLVNRPTPATEERACTESGI